MSMDSIQAAKYEKDSGQENLGQETKSGVKKWKVVVGFVFLLLVVAIQVPFYSTSVIRYLGDTAEGIVPGLALNNIQGSLVEGLSLDVEIQNPGVLIEVNNLSLDFSLACLLKIEACIQQLAIDSIDVYLTPLATSPNTTPSNIVLPDIMLPLPISIESLVINSFTVNQNQSRVYSVNDIRSKLSLVDSQLRIRSFQANDQFCLWQLSTSLQVSDTYPIDGALTCQSNQGYGLASIQLSQSISDLKIDLLLNPAHPLIKQSGEVAVGVLLQPLDPELPFEASIALQKPSVLILGTDELKVSSLNVELVGRNFETDIKADTLISSSRWPDDHHINLVAHADKQQLLLHSAQWQLPKGMLIAKGNLHYQQGLRWQGQLEGQNVELSYWQKFVDGVVSGLFQTDLVFENGELNSEIQVERLNGIVNQQSFQGDGHLRLTNQQLNLEGVQINIDQSFLKANGVVSADRLDVATQVQIYDLNHWLKDLTGALEGQISLQGSVSDPAIKGTINGSSIGYQQIYADDIQLSIDWQALAAAGNKVAISTKQLSYQQMSAKAELVWQGSLQDHRWQWFAQGLDKQSDKQMIGSCSGAWLSPTWDGKCSQLNVDFAYFDWPQQWQLMETLEISFNASNKTFQLSSFCLQNDKQLLCNHESINAGQADIASINLEASNFSSRWLQPWLPAGLHTDGLWQAHLTVGNPLTQLALNADIETNNSVLQWQQNEQNTTQVQIKNLRADWQWQQQAQQHHQLGWLLNTEKNGSIQGQLDLDGDKIQGDISLRQWQLVAISRILLPQPKDQLQGTVDSQFTLAGTINKPIINGTMQLKNGAIRAAVLPVPIKDIQIDLNVVDNTATMQGVFIANDSKGELGGELFWSPEQWRGELSLKAQDLAYSPEPNIQVHVSPDVKLELSPQLVSLSGDIHVPRANIELEQLPEQAVSVSSDTIIIGSDDEKQQQQVKTNLHLILGENVRFKGFGLETNIAGNLNLQQNPNELLRGQGVLQLKKGRYKAYGQDLSIRNGDLVFVSDIENPQIRLEAIRDPLKTADDVTVGLRATGAARQPQITIFSEPVLAQQAQLSYLIWGTAPGVETDSDASQIAAQSALSYALESQTGENISRFAGRALGIDNLKVTTDSNENGTQIGLSGYITPNLLVRYGVGVFDTVNSLTLNYKLKKNLYLEAVSGQSSALDLLWSFDKD